MIRAGLPATTTRGGVFIREEIGDLAVDRITTEFGDDVNGQFWASPTKKLVGKLTLQEHPHFLDAVADLPRPAPA